MTICELLERVNSAIESAEFDRERFKVGVKEGEDGTSVVIRAYTLFDVAGAGERGVNDLQLPLERVPDSDEYFAAMVVDCISFLEVSVAEHCQS